MILLSIETSADVCSLAISEDLKLLVSVKWSHKMQLSTRLHGILNQAFTMAQLTPDQVDAYAIGLGPGSFTGTRVAVVMGKTLAVATGKPLYGVDSLEMMAHQPLQSNPGCMVLTMLKARIGEVYAAVYGIDDLNKVFCIIEPSVYTPESMQDMLDNRINQPVIISGYIPDCFQSTVNNHELFRAYQPCLPDAELLAEISYKQALNGQTLDALLQMPCYVKQASITVSKRRLVNPFAPE